MARHVTEILTDLGNLDLDGEFMGDLYALCDELELLPDAAPAVDPVFRFIERNTGADLGAPGPLVHFLETVPGYQSHLMESLARLPTYYNIWMLNRILNVAVGDEKAALVSVLRGISEDPSASEDARDTARRFLSHHNS